MQTEKPMKKVETNSKNTTKSFSEQQDESHSKTKFMQEHDDFEPKVTQPNSI